MNRMSRLGRVLLLALPLLLAGAGCHIDDLTLDCWDGDECGPLASRTLDLSGFDAIRVEDAFRVTVRQGDTFRVEVSVPERSEGNGGVRLDGTWLRIGGWSGCGGDRRASVTLPSLRRLEAEAASRVVLEGISSPGRIELDLSSASHVGGDLTADSLLVRLSTASEAELDGTTERLELDASEVSRARLRDLSSRRAEVRLRTASTATISVSERLDVTASGASVLRYAGNPELGRIDLSDASRIERER